MNRTQTAELKKHEDERDFFCVASDAFRVFARKASAVLGSARAFAVGHSHHRRVGDDWTDVPLFRHVATNHQHQDDHRHFLMVFLIQNTQNRDAKAVHLKLDEIIGALEKARNELVDLEELSDEELGRLEDQFRRLRTKAENQGTNMRHVEPEALEANR